MSQKVLQISAEDARYIDPNQIASLTMTDGSVILIQGNQQEEGFVEEAQESDQYTTNQVQQQQQQPALRGLGTVGKIALGVAGTAAAIGAASAIGNALSKSRRPMMGGPMIGGPMMGPGMGMRRPMMGPGMGMRGPMMGPGMGMRGPMMGPMGRPGMMMGPGFRARKKDETNEEEVCPYCNK